MRIVVLIEFSMIEMMVKYIMIVLMMKGIMIDDWPSMYISLMEMHVTEVDDLLVEIIDWVAELTSSKFMWSTNYNLSNTVANYSHRWEGTNDPQ